MDQEEPEIQTSGMACPNCYGRNPASVSFCTHCGQPTRPENGGCSSCFAKLPKDAQFCPECGAPAGIPMGSFPRAEPEYMGFWIRAAARLIDTVVIGAMVVLIETFYGPLPPKLTILLFSCIVYPFYYVAPTGLSGQTLGKMALGIMVVNKRGKPPGIKKRNHPGNPRQIRLRNRPLPGIPLGRTGRQETGMARPHRQHLRNSRSWPARAPRRRQTTLIAGLNRSPSGSSGPPLAKGEPGPPAKPRNHPLATAASPTEWLQKRPGAAFLPSG